MTCRTCKYYDLEAVKDKAGRVRQDRVARCLWAFSVPLPDSITTAYDYHAPRALRYMSPVDGVECPTQEARDAR